MNASRRHQSNLQEQLWKLDIFLKCILVVLVFFGLAFSSQNFGDVFPCTKKSMMKKRYVFAKKNVHSRDTSSCWAHDHRNGTDTTPWPCPNGQNLGKSDVRLGSCVGVGLTSGTAVEETDYRQTPTSPAARWLS